MTPGSNNLDLCISGCSHIDAVSLDLSYATLTLNHIAELNEYTKQRRLTGQTLLLQAANLAAPPMQLEFETELATLGKSGRYHFSSSKGAVTNARRETKV